MAPTAIAQVELAADVLPGPDSSQPLGLTVFEGALYFSVLSGVGDVGKELFRFTPAGGVELVADLRPGTGSSAPGNLTEYDGALYFSADASDDIGHELYRYVPTVGAELVADLAPGAAGSYPGGLPAGLTVHDGALYFSARSSVWGHELHRYSTGGEIESVFDALGGLRVRSPADVVEFGGELYFSAYEGISNGYRQLYRLTASSGVEVVSDGSLFLPENLTPLAEALYFTAEANQGIGELYRYTTGDGVQHVADIRPREGPRVGGLTEYKGALYFGTYLSDDVGRELYRYTVSGGVELVADLRPGVEGAYPTALTVHDGALYFAADAVGDYGFELHRYTDSGGVERFSEDVLVGSSRGLTAPPDELVPYGRELYFKAYEDPEVGGELYRYMTTGEVTAESGPGAPSIELHAWPNPTRGPITLTVGGAGNEPLRLSLYDTLGRRLAVLFEGAVRPGSAIRSYVPYDLPTGIYTVRTEGGAGSQLVTVVR